MEANELRIGNYVYTDNLVVKSYSADGLYNLIKSIEEGTDKIKPIPLTEEWLLKLGFKDNDYTFDLMFKRKKITVSWYSRIVLSGIRGGFYISKYRHIKYIHQLQNLYFALTENELKINN